MIENAKIRSTALGTEDHGIFTCYVVVEGDGWSCGFGGYALDSYEEAKKKRVGTGYGVDFIKSILTVLEVDEWEKLPGKYCRVETNGIGGTIARLGHPIKNKWFDPKELKP